MENHKTKISSSWLSQTSVYSLLATQGDSPSITLRILYYA